MVFTKRRARVLLLLIIFAAAVIIFALLKGSRTPSQAREPLERARVVQVRELSFADFRPMLELYGKVISGNEVELRPSVEGRVRKRLPGFRDGAMVHQDDLLLTIEGLDCLNAVYKQEEGWQW